MESKYAIVIDNKGYKVGFVLVNFVVINKETKKVIQGYSLKNGESLIYDGISTALSMLKPRWNGSAWEETATLEEITAAQPEPVERQPSETEIIMLAVAELYEKFEKVLGGATA